MLLNEKTAVSTSRVLLVPYCKHHVPQYHEWMRDPTILEATASERLSLEEEYAMQENWRRDPNKLTFIVCAPVFGLVDNAKGLIAGLDDVSGMVGDVNMFLTTTEEDDNEEAKLVGELELMVALRENQGLGYGKGALLTFLRYITDHEEDIATEFASVAGDSRKSQRLYLCAKIGEQNHRSIALFESVGFLKTSQKPSYFGEFELRHKPFSSEAVDALLAKYDVETYAEMTYEGGRG
jgi:RimJ/RimL family protein N-acetyltransferase